MDYPNPGLNTAGHIHRYSFMGRRLPKQVDSVLQNPQVAVRIDVASLSTSASYVVVGAGFWSVTQGICRLNMIRLLCVKPGTLATLVRYSGVDGDS